MKPVIVLGAGGHARVLIDALRLRSVKILGVADPAADKASLKKMGLKVVGGDDGVLKYPPSKIQLVNGVGSVRVSGKRAAIFSRFKKKGYVFATVVHPTAIVASGVELGEGAQIMAGVILQTGVKIGKNTIVNTRVSVDHDCVIGAHAHLAPGVVLSGDVRVGDGSHLGTGAVVTQGADIGAGTFVRANSLVHA
ncbi:MAG: sugar acetyltransferase [Omnitrophica bacterium RIFCSPHIGHO2_02_FULL_51_18]|nr:MAG: sugar acetyltransferase [Omnitrophica bacterium RIFCSPHIGHO2_02_FULL_51_18]